MIHFVCEYDFRIPYGKAIAMALLKQTYELGYIPESIPEGFKIVEFYTVNNCYTVNN